MPNDFLYSREESIKRLIEQGDAMFGKRISWLTLWQEIADNFYVERADFIYQRTPYQHLANMLTNSFPLTIRRDLANVFSTMLRPSDKDWFYMRPSREESLDVAGRQWLERAALIQRRVMYDRNSQFVRATKEGDNDFAAFGQCVITVEMNAAREGALYRCWHLRDTAWAENSEGKITRVQRKWKPTVRDLCDLFADKKDASVHEKIKEKLLKEPNTEVQCRHIVVPFDEYTPEDGKMPAQRKGRFSYKYWSIFYDADNKHVMKATPMTYFMYVIPRWQTVSGSQYALAPCAAAGTPDARLLQQMTLTILEASEWAASPPFVATEEAVRSDLAVYPRGVTWVDPEYDERLGAALRPIQNDPRGLPQGVAMLDRIQTQLYNTFYLNKIGLPPVTAGMTAYEASQRVAEYIRNSLPLFEPMESEYNGALCESTFDMLFINGAFGPFSDIPESLQGENIQFGFIGPLTEAKEQQKGQQFLQAMGIVAEAAKVDPDAVLVMDTTLALRDALNGTAPASWMRTPEAIDTIKAAKAQAAEQQQTLANLEQGGKVAAQYGAAAKSLSDASQNATAIPQQ